MHFVYMIRNTYDDLYIGITENPEQRLKYHNEHRGALFTRRDVKFKIVFLEKQATLAEARKREIQIKKWRRDKKEDLIKLYKQGFPTSPLRFPNQTLNQIPTRSLGSRSRNRRSRS